MSLRVIEGFDWFPSGQSWRDYLFAADAFYWIGNPVTFNTVGGAFGGSAICHGGDIFPADGRYPIVLLTGVSPSSGTIGCRVYRNGSDTAHPMLVVYDTTNTYGHLSFVFSYFGSLEVWRGIPGIGTATLLAKTPSGTFFMDNWFYFEAQFVISATVGSVLCKINAGVPTHLTGIVVNLTNVDTLATASATTDGIGVGYYPTTSGTVQALGAFDDLYMTDTAGAVNTGFLGNVRVQQLMTASAGATTDLSIGGSAPAGSNWASRHDWQLQEYQYVYTPTTGQFDLYNVAPMINTGTVFGVQVRGAMRQDDATEIEGQNLLYSAGVQGTTTPRLMSETYAYYKDILETDPNTGLGWLAANVNAVQIGTLKAA